MSQDTDVPTSPEDPRVRDAGRVSTLKDFSGGMTLDLTDDEIKRAMEITITTKAKWQEIFRRKFPFDSIEAAMDLVDNFEDEIKTRMAEELNLLVAVDVQPLLEGHPIEVEFVGALPGHTLNTYGMDHEKKEFEVKRATELGHDAFLNQDRLNT